MFLVGLLDQKCDVVQLVLPPVCEVESTGYEITVKNDDELLVNQGPSVFAQRFVGRERERKAEAALYSYGSHGRGARVASSALQRPKDSQSHT